MLLRDKSPMFGKGQQVCAAGTPLTKQVNMDRLTAAWGAGSRCIHGHAECSETPHSGILSTELVRLKCRGVYFRSCTHTYINYSCDLSFIYKLQATSLFSPVAFFIVFYIRTVLQDKTRVCWFSVSCECGITAAVFSRAFLATRKWNCCSSLQIICGDFQPADFLGGI